MTRKARTAVYVDGFNLYYGVLQGTPHRWLDIRSAVASVLGDYNEISKIDYFTALIDRNVNPQGYDRQRIYLAALRHCTPGLEIVYGHFLAHAKTMLNVSPPPRFCRVIHTEEKGSDVNLAVHLVRDAFLDAFDVAIIVSNDSDLAGAINIVREHTKKPVGVMMPLNAARKGSKVLTRAASFVRRLRETTVAANQLPDEVEGTRIRRPDYWK